MYLKNMEEAMTRYMNEHEAAEYMSMSVHKLRKDRREGTGCPYSKASGKIIYDREDIDKFISSSKIIPKS